MPISFSSACPLCTLVPRVLIPSLAVAMFAIGLLSAAPVSAGLAGARRIDTNLGQPIYLAQPPGDHERMFIITKAGQIRILDLATETLLPTPFLTVSDTFSATNEAGLLGIAFHPDYQNNGKFYVNVTIDNGEAEGELDTRIREYTVSAHNPNVADPTPRDIMRISQPQVQHNAGWLGFSPVNGYLYIPTGDGGNGFDAGPGHTDTIGNAQDLTDNLLGKLLRIDVNGDDFPADETRNYAIPPDNPYVGVEGDDEIFDYGFRNPYRANFDRATGDLWIGDVGQVWFEEVNLHRADEPGGINFGWKEMEGSGPTMLQNGNVVGSTINDARLPEYDYLNLRQSGDPDFQGSAVAPGTIYRGPDPSLRGMFLFADAASGNHWMFDPADPEGTITRVNPLLEAQDGMVGGSYGYAQDNLGNLYYGAGNGDIYRILTDELTPGDFNADGMVDATDLGIWQAGFGLEEGATEMDGDANGDGAVTGADYLFRQRNHGDSSLNVPAAPPAAGVPEPPAYAMLIIAAAGWYACLWQRVGVARH